MQQRTFTERFLEHLDKVDPSEVQNYVLRTAQERDFFARIFESLVEGVVVVDADFRVTLANVAARRILGLPMRRRLAGEPLKELVREEALQRMLEDFIQNPRQLQNEEVMLGSGKMRRIYNVHLLFIGEPGEKDEHDGAALILQDITPAHDKQAKTAQAERFASLATLTSGVAHEIKNPLNSLSIHAQLLERAMREFGETASQEKPVERIIRSCDVIMEEVQRLRQCVDDFIQAARPSRPIFSWNNLNTIIESVVRMADLEFEERAIRIDTFLDPDMPAMQIDQRQIEHALRNLLRNAVEAIDAARRPADQRSITLRTQSLGEIVSLEISDSGCGIAPEDVPKIFEPYYTTKFSGSGLGLMAVARIVREHGGQISVNSLEGEGTTFIIELPALNRRIKLLTKE